MDMIDIKKEQTILQVLMAIEHDIDEIENNR